MFEITIKDQDGKIFHAIKSQEWQVVRTATGGLSVFTSDQDAELFKAAAFGSSRRAGNGPCFLIPGLVGTQPVRNPYRFTS